MPLPGWPRAASLAVQARAGRAGWTGGRLGSCSPAVCAGWLSAGTAGLQQPLPVASCCPLLSRCSLEGGWHLGVVTAGPTEGSVCLGYTRPDHATYWLCSLGLSASVSSSVKWGSSHQEDCAREVPSLSPHSHTQLQDFGD